MEEIKKDGVVFSLDAAIAVTVVIILLINTSYYFSTASRESISQMHIVRIGSDVLNMLDLSGDLRRAVVADYGATPSQHPLISDTILNVSKYLPESYDMRIEIFDMGESPVNVTEVYCGDSQGYDCNPPLSVPLSCFCNRCSDNSGPADGCNVTNGAIGFNVTTPSLERAGYYALRLYVNSSVRSEHSNMTINVTANGVTLPTLIGKVNYTGYLLGPGLLWMNSGKNNISFRGYSQPSTDTSTATIKWYTLLGAKEYTGITGTGTPLRQKDLPKMVNETFIASGEKIIPLNETSSLDFMRLVRYYIWIK